MQAKRTALAQFQQQSEKFNELVVLNHELTTLKSQVRNSRPREK